MGIFYNSFQYPGLCYCVLGQQNKQQEFKRSNRHSNKVGLILGQKYDNGKKSILLKKIKGGRLPVKALFIR